MYGYIDHNVFILLALFTIVQGHLGYLNLYDLYSQFGCFKGCRLPLFVFYVKYVQR